MPEPNYNIELEIHERALHYGDGLFETLLKYDGKLPLWDAHYDRLSRGCNRLSIPIPDENWLKQHIAEESRDPVNAVIKIIVSRGRGGRGLRLPAPPRPSVFVLCYPWSESQQSGHQVSICKTRLPINANLAGLKHLNRLDYVLAAIELQDIPDVTEGILCDSEGFLVEGLISNLFFVTRSEIFTPTLEFAGVAGIMRARILEHYRKLKIPVIQGRFPSQNLLESSECFLCNSVRGITPIIAIDQQHFDVGTHTQTLMAALNLPAMVAF